MDVEGAEMEEVEVEGVYFEVKGVEVEGVWFEAKGCRRRLRGCILGLSGEGEVERTEVEVEV